MRKYLLLIIGLSFALSSLIGQSSALPTEANNDMPVIVNDSLMFIGQHVDSLTEEQRYFNPIYLIVQKGKEYLKNQLIHASVCDCDTTIPNRRIGVFSVAPNKYVSFSQGNLQYFPAANLWKFADNQYEHLGASNKYFSPTYRNWLDLFGWSSDSGKAPFGISTSTNIADYKGNFVDWGSNWICGDPPSTWRTLSKQEWEYLIQERPMASSLYGMAQVIGINGIVLLPDKWLAPEGITFIPGGHTNDGIGYFSQHQSFSVEQWRLLEESGAVFLPAAGIFISPNNFITAIEEGAHYYTSNQYDEDNAYWFGFRSSYYTINYNKKHMRRSVRLVHDTIISFEPEYVDLGLSVKWATCNVGATKPEEYGNYFAWGETDSKEVYDWNSYLWCNGTEESINKYNTTDGLTTLLPEDDAAHVNWGEEWRMPTDKEWTELRENCIWTQTMQSGINGYKVTGINGNSIFLPAAGFHYANGLSYTNSHGDYWSSSRNAVNLNGALHIYFEPNSVNRSNSYRYYGFPIRPVYVDHTLSEPITPTSRIGVFSVSQNKQVSFAQGDLQYIQSEEKWRFADTQYEFTGKRHFQNGQLNDTIMYFGWSGKGSNAPWGISLSVKQKDYEGVFLDWGTNRISEYAPNTWRTISNDELNFLCKERKNAELLIGLGKIGDIGGLILLPDDWTLPQNLHFEPLTNNYTANQYTLQEWTEMENAGAIFLSMSGYFNHKLDNMRFVGSQGFIKTNTLLNERQVYSLFTPNNILYSYQGNNTGNLYYAFPVRLIRDTIPPPPAPCQTFEVNGVTFNMMCVEGGTFVMGATDSDTSAQDDERPQHQVALSNFMIGQTEVTQELWTAVMGSNPSKNKGTLLPVEQVNWEDCEIFITRLNQLTGRNFRLPTEAEWDYAARGGQKSHGFIYAGSDNLDEVAWYDGNSSNKTHNVGTKLPNELGIYDMSGNVYERCYDWYAPYTAEAQVNPKGPTSAQTYRTVRGGGAEQSAYGNSIVCRVLNRGFSTPKSRESYIGLRLVLDEHEYVDLGLSVMWATTNVGAESAEEYGDYFAWGETETKEVYDWSTYKWCDGTENNMTKYNATDDLITLLPEDDAAHVNWGGEWRMPTDAELQELIDNCTWKWDEINGTEGYYVTSNINNNHIFIPASGYKIGGGTSSINRNCQYWSNTLCNDLHAFVYHAYKSGSHVKKCTGSNRSAGQSVRPVLPTDREILAPATPAKRIGVFSVEKDKQVSFSQGNLQYVQYRDEWRFAENQYDYIGAGNVKNGALADKIDLFGWSGEDNNAPFGVSTSTNNADYAGEFVDWGSNVIQGDTANTWRTLSKGELEYLIKGRKNASNLRAAAQVNGVNGMVLLPDDWECPEGIDFKAGYHTSKGSEYYAEYQQFTKEQWRELETTGAIFLPAAGMHDGNGIADIQAGGYYWSATDNGDTYAYTLISQSSGAYLTYDNRYDVRSVRLVHDTIVPPPAPCQTFEVNGVSFNMMCVEGGTFMMGAAEDDPDARADEKPQHQVTVSDFMIAQTEVTQELWTAVMGNNPSHFSGNNLPVDAASWNDCQAFIAKLNELTSLHFRLPTEAEWEFAARGGNHSRGYKYAGSDNIDEVAWYDGNSSNTPHEVGTKLPNELGLFDMSGNVWEFCQDWYSNTYYTAEAQTNPTGPTSGTHRVDRGGSWFRSATHCRIPYRDSSRPTVNDYRLGLRLVLDKHEYVDLGLSVMWATTNVGAESAEEYGDYFAWGETTPKEEYNTTTYQYYDRSTGQYTKYGSDSLTMLEPEDDAAHVNWGGEWRMPSKEEMNELIDKCTWTWTQYNGIDGYEVTGTNGNSIFLPAAGYKGSGGPSYPAGEYGLYWLKNELNVAHNYFADLLFFKSETSIKLGHDGARRFGFTIRPVLPTNRDSKPDDDKVTVTIHATPSDASISLFCSGYTKEDNKITVDKGKSVLYQVSNVENCYLSQGDSLLNMTKDTTLYISLKSFSDGAWETIDNSTMKHTPNCYISRNNCRFAQYQNWEFYVMPATKGEIYRIRTIAGQHAAPWIAVSNPPDLATLTYATQVACSPNKGMAAYIAEEFVVPEGTNYLIINYRKSNSHPLIIERKVTDIQPIDTNSYTLVLGNDYNPLFCDSTDRASIMPYTIFIPKGVTIAPKPGYRWGYYTDVDTLNMPSGKLQYAWTTDSYVGEGKPVGITIKKDSGVFDFSSDSRYATDYFYTSDPSIWIKSSSED